MIARPLARQRGSAAVEAVLILPVIATLAMLAGDLSIVARARVDLERSASTLSSILAAQRSLTGDGLDRLLAATLPDATSGYQVFVGQVWRSGRVAWGLRLGSNDGPCPNPLATGATYPGPLPERDSGDDTNSVAMMVVQLCQPSATLSLSSLLLGSDRLMAVAVDRLRTTDLKLDTGLIQRAGLSPPKASPGP